MDLRSAGDQERLFQHRAAGRGGAALRAQPVRDHHQPAARRACRPTAASPSGGCARRRVELRCWMARPMARPPVEDAHRGARSTSTGIRRDDPARAREIQRRSERAVSSTHFDRGLAVIGLRAHRAQPEPILLGDHGTYVIDERSFCGRSRMPLVHFFETSFGRTYERQIVLVEVVSDGVSGWGEVTGGEKPFYNEEWTDSAWLIVTRLRCAARGRATDLDSAEAAAPLTEHIRGHRMARGGLEAAVWDLEARLAGVRCGSRSAAARARKSPAAFRSAFRTASSNCIEKIETELDAGYQRIKIKIKPGWDVDVVRRGARAISRRITPDGRRQLRLHAGRRRSICKQARRVRPDDDRAAAGARRHHRPRRAAGQARRRRSAWTNASASAHHAEQAIRLRACRIINIKLGRVGGFRGSAARPRRGAGGGHSGVVRRHARIRASAARTTSRSRRCPNFVLPGDVSASARYWARDIIAPASRGHAARDHRRARRAGLRLRASTGSFCDSITVRQETRVERQLMRAR